MDELCLDLASTGLPAWNLEYRRLPAASWLEISADVAAGIDAIAGLGVDSSRVVAIGHSAGGQLALWAAARPAPHVAVTHAVSQAGVADLREGARLALSVGVVRDLLGGAPEAVPEHYAAASPAELLPLGVPQLLVHGGLDDTVPASIGRAYAKQALAAGDEVVLLIDPLGGHFEHLDPSSAAWLAVRDWLDGRLA